MFRGYFWSYVQKLLLAMLGTIWDTKVRTQVEQTHYYLSNPELSVLGLACAYGPAPLTSACILGANSTPKVSPHGPERYSKKGLSLCI